MADEAELPYSNRPEDYQPEALVRDTLHLEEMLNRNGKDKVKEAVLAWVRKKKLHDPDNGVHRPYIAHELIGNAAGPPEYAMHELTEPDTYGAGLPPRPTPLQFCADAYSKACWKKKRALGLVVSDTEEPPPDHDLALAETPLPEGTVDYYIAHTPPNGVSRSKAAADFTFTAGDSSKVSITLENVRNAITAEASMVAWKAAGAELRTAEANVTTEIGISAGTGPQATNRVLEVLKQQAAANAGPAVGGDDGIVDGIVR